MGLSVIQEQHDVILQQIQHLTQGEWKCLIVDESSRRTLNNCVKEDDILNNNIATIERIEERREMNSEMDAIYLLSPESHIVDCLLADFECRRYRSAHLLWTSLLDPSLRRRIDDFPGIRDIRASSNTVFIDFCPRESHLVVFRDPWSFPLLYHPACNALVPQHLQALAQKIASVCITIGEYPKIRYYWPSNARHDAHVLCAHLARFVQEELDSYAQWHANFPPPSQRPQSTLIIADRSMDLMAPLVHEFSYQAMAHDLLPLKDGDKVTFHTTVNEGTAEVKEKDMELGENDKIWVENRHRHMKDTIDKLMGDFQKFLDQNPHFTNDKTNAADLNAIRDMLAGLPQFQEMKEAYSLHLTMAQQCMDIFQRHKLPDIASVEQTLSTGLDEDFRKPKHILSSVVRLLDDGAITPTDRLRLIVMYVLYRGGVIVEDIKRLLAHASLPQADGEALTNLHQLGGHTTRGLKDVAPPPPPIFPKDWKNAQVNEEYALSRFEPVLKSLLEAMTKGTLDPSIFPHVKPPMDPNEDLLAAQGGSLRAGRPNWASSGRRPAENRQRLIVFMAGGATYSESRVCYEVGNERSRDIVLVTSHMLSPQLFLRQVGDLSRDKRQLDLPVDRPKPRAPAHLFERPTLPTAPTQPSAGSAPPRPAMPASATTGRAAPRVGGGLPSRPVPRGAPPTQAMASMALGSGPSNGALAAAAAGAPGDHHHGDGKMHKEKKRRNFLGMKK